MKEKLYISVYIYCLLREARAVVVCDNGGGDCYYI